MAGRQETRTLPSGLVVLGWLLTVLGVLAWMNADAAGTPGIPPMFIIGAVILVVGYLRRLSRPSGPDFTR